MQGPLPPPFRDHPPPTCSKLFNLDLTTQGPPRQVQTCSNWTSLHRGTTPTHSQNMFKLVHHVTRMSVGKWAVGIRLKCLLVRYRFVTFHFFSSFEYQPLSHISLFLKFGLSTRLKMFSNDHNKLFVGELPSVVFVV